MTKQSQQSDSYLLKLYDRLPVTVTPGQLEAGDLITRAQRYSKGNFNHFEYNGMIKKIERFNEGYHITYEGNVSKVLYDNQQYVLFKIIEPIEKTY